MRMTRRILYYPAITLIALTLTLAVLMVLSTYRNWHKGQEQMEESLVLEASALLRLFETMVDYGMADTSEEATMFQQLAGAIAPNDDIAYVALFDQEGKVLAHTQSDQRGTHISGAIPSPGELLRLRNDTQTEHVLEIRREFHPPESTISDEHFVALGLRMTALEQAHSADHRHNVMMAAILILLGSASLFFILVVQNFYLVQQTLGRMKSYIHYVIESMANGLISLDADGLITTMNPVASNLTGISEDEARGEHIQALLTEQANQIELVLGERVPILNREITYQRRDGTVIPVSMSVTQVRDDYQNPLGAVIILHDLREVKELQERAKRSEHLASIGRMAATVAHEIRNPLSSIRGFAQYFAAMFGGKQEEHGYAVAMMEESDRLNRVVSQLLDYARPLELNSSLVDVRKLFGDVSRMVSLDTEAQKVQIIQDVDDALGVIRVDRDRMLQVLLNLIQNSIAAMQEGDEIMLRAAPYDAEGAVMLSVEDTGVGISEEDIPQLFEPFFTTKTRGTGLGLAVVRKIVDAHDGQVRVESEVGKGTHITLILPQHNRAEEMEETHGNPHPDCG